ncbi:kelch-like protein 26 [Branchiostoma floridae x Branchiostoma belcheri]
MAGTDGSNATTGEFEAVVRQSHRTLTDSAFGKDMLSVLNDLRAEGVLLDVTVVAGEEEFRAHSTALAYGSDYFRRLFTSGMKESQDNRVELRDPSISAEGFRLLLNFLYSGELVVSTESVYDVLLVANHLQVQSIMKLCYDFISQNMHDAPLDLANYTEAQKVADAYGLTTLQEKVHSALADNFLELSTSDDFLRSITLEQLVAVLQANDVVSPSELQVYEAVVRWLMHDEQTRMPHAAEVLSHVRFALLDQNTLYGLLQTDIGTVENCKHLILEAMAYHSLSPEIKQGIEWPRSKPRTTVDNKVLLALASKKAWSFTAKGWTEEAGNVRPPGVIHAVAVVGNVLYAVSTVAKPSFLSYDPTKHAWENLPLPPDCHNDFKFSKMTAMAEKLFLVQSKEDNCSSKAYCYDISERQWMKIPSFPRSSQGVALTSCQGAVFAVGGYVQGIVNGKQAVVPTSAVHTFFPPNNAWEAVSPTTRPHTIAAAMVQGDNIYIAGGYTFENGQLSWNTTVEKCRAGLKVTMKGSPWSVVPQPSRVHKFASQVAVIDRKAYFILGRRMHFTGKFVDQHTSEEDVENMCQAFEKGVQANDINACVTIALPETNGD